MNMLLKIDMVVSRSTTSFLGPDLSDIEVLVSEDGRFSYLEPALDSPAHQLPIDERGCGSVQALWCPIIKRPTETTLAVRFLCKRSSLSNCMC